MADQYSETIILCLGPLAPYFSFPTLKSLNCVSRRLHAACQVYIEMNDMKLNERRLYNHQRNIILWAWKRLQASMAEHTQRANLTPTVPALSRREVASGRRSHFTTLYDFNYTAEGKGRTVAPISVERFHSLAPECIPTDLFIESYMGSGKTAMALKLAQMMIDLPRGKRGDYTFDRQHVIIVAPKDVIQPWVKEVDNFYPGHKTSRDYENSPIMYYAHISKSQMSWLDRQEARLDSYTTHMLTCIGREVIEDNNYLEEVCEKETCYPADGGRMKMMGFKSYNSIKGDESCGPELFALKKGKILIVSPFMLRHIPNLLSNARLVIIDEAHSLEQRELAKSSQTYTISMSASPMETAIPKNTYRYAESESLRRPDFKLTVVNAEITSIVTKVGELIGAHPGEHIIVAGTSYPKFMNNEIVKNSAGKTLPIHKYDNYQITIMKKFQAEGGVLVSSIQKICKGNSFNLCSLMIILNMSQKDITREDIVQCTGRIRRDSNLNGSVEVVIIDTCQFQSAIVSNAFLQYRLANGVDYNEGRRFRHMNSCIFIEKYLMTHGIDLAALSIAELSALFTESEEVVDAGPPIKTNIPAPILLALLGRQ